MCALKGKINSDQAPMEDPLAGLERMYIEQFLAEKGYRWCELSKLPAEEIKHLMTEACKFASARLAEIEARGGFIHDIHYK